MTERLNFYSARDEPPKRPKAPPTKAKGQPKAKITTAVLAQQVASLSTQLQALASQTEMLLNRQAPQPGATPAGDPPNVRRGFSRFSSTKGESRPCKLSSFGWTSPKTRPAPDAADLGIPPDEGSPWSLPRTSRNRAPSHGPCFNSRRRSAVW